MRRSGTTGHIEGRVAAIETKNGSVFIYYKQWLSLQFHIPCRTAQERGLVYFQVDVATVVLSRPIPPMTIP